jgi:hypothetical protein
MTVTLAGIQEKASAELVPGDIVIAGGRARYLREKLSHSCGYDQWACTYYELPSATYAGAVGTEVNILRSGKMPVIVLREYSD